jgi:uncharacterized repeat protein (TIGR01451 family)
LADGVSAAVNLSATYDYFLQRLGRDSLDGNGGNMLGIVRVGQGLANAFFNGSTQTMYFGDAEPFAGALDVVAHEMGHGVIDTSIPGGLTYFGQSGALNESFADIFGEMAEQHFNQTNPDWLIGTRLSSPLRNMRDPGAMEFAPGRPFPSKMSEFVSPDDPVLNLFVDKDNNGVHINSSIINHAYYLLTSGANGISFQDADRIFYRALTTKLSALSEFIDMRFAAIQSAEELFGTNSTQAQQTAAAFDSVEIFDSPSNPLPSPFPDVAGGDATLFVYWDGVIGAYYLGRWDQNLGDIAPGIQLSANPMNLASPSVSGDGSFAIFVDSQQDVCLIATDGSSIESCLGFPGEIASVAVAPDGNTFGFVFLDALGNPTNEIGVIDIATSQQQLFTLVSPNIDGASSIDVIQADAMDFTSDNRFIVYDAFNAIDFGDGSSVGLWSIYAIDLVTTSTITLTTPTPGFHTGFPNIAQTSDGHMTFDAFDISVNENMIVAANLYTGDAAGIATTGPVFAIPVYTGDDSGIVFSVTDAAVPTGASLRYAPIDVDRITPNGAFTLWLADAFAGTIYRRGTFTPASRVDIGVRYTAQVAGDREHAAYFEVEVFNTGTDTASGVTLTASIPPNVDALATSSTGNCIVLADRIECQFDVPGIIPGGFERSEFRFTLTSPSSSGQIVSSATAFAEQPDTNTQDNTVITLIDEALLNRLPFWDEALSLAQATANQQYSFDAARFAVEWDGDPLRFSATGLPGGLSIDPDSGLITGTPGIGSVGTHDISLTITDTFDESASESVTLVVLSPPPPPPPTPVSSGGGGGGSFGMLSLVALSWFALRRRVGARLLGSIQSSRNSCL